MNKDRNNEVNILFQLHTLALFFLNASTIHSRGHKTRY